MKRKLALLIGSLCLLAGSGQAAELSRYAEFARAYGIVRYFSPNPYTEGVVRERLDEGLHAVSLPNRHTAAGAGIPTACPDPRLLGGADTAPECRHPGRPRAILQLQRLRRTAHSVYRPAAHPRTGPVHPLLQKAGAGCRPAGHLGSATARDILHLPGGGGKVPAYPARPAQRAVRRPGDAPPARRGEKLLGQPPKCGQDTLPAAQFHFRTAGRPGSPHGRSDGPLEHHPPLLPLLRGGGSRLGAPSGGVPAGGGRDGAPCNLRGRTRMARPAVPLFPSDQGRAPLRAQGHDALGPPVDLPARLLCGR